MSWDVSMQKSKTRLKKKILIKPTIRISEFQIDLRTSFRILKRRSKNLALRKKNPVPSVVSDANTRERHAPRFKTFRPLESRVRFYVDRATAVTFGISV